MSAADHIARARTRKVLAILAELDATCGGRPGIPKGELPAALRLMGEDWWESIARRAGVRPPSAETLKLVIEAVSRRAA